MKRIRGKFYQCNNECDECDGKGYIIVGSHGFINKNLEQDVRDVLDACPNAEIIELEEET